ncbi:copper homeostasis protein CutC [Phenylobacterium sp.]|uniref:copper homeostasis protein CutC n=1 Tax=Phenylobacterium sp. TaxID=1871053 RepID=UPI0012118FBC|nr:copper homeostasis protein CutC [Phenylobacterium sp.]THD70611.1 MAG: copper homeostasis protein CutC [Phenylobacterium sp.]
MSRPRLEICLDTPAGLAAAVAGGADRIELCSALDSEGLTPAPGLMAQAGACGVETFALIRSRAGDFVFGDLDLDAMRRDIDAARAAGLAGVVLGASRPDGRLDEAALGDLIAHASGLGVALHRAFDVTPDKAQALETAIGLGFARILTSGGRPGAPEGAEVIADLVQRAGSRIVIMAGAGLEPGNVADFVRRTGVKEVHAACRAALPVRPGTAEGGELDAELGFVTPGLQDTSQALVEAMRRELEALG